jgi:hypothetical protein
MTASAVFKHRHPGVTRCEHCGTVMPHTCWQSGVRTILTLSEDSSAQTRETTDDLSGKTGKEVKKRRKNVL